MSTKTFRLTFLQQLPLTFLSLSKAHSTSFGFARRSQERSSGKVEDPFFREDLLEEQSGPSHP